MKCTNCEKEFQTYNKVCPFCHSKNKTDDQAELNIRNNPYQESRPPIPLQTNRLTERVNTNTPIKSRSSNQTLKYALIVGMGLLVLLSVAAMTQSFLGGSSLSASAPGIGVSSTPTDKPIPSLPPLTSSTQPKITYSGGKAGTLSPYSGDHDSVNPNRVAPDYTAPGYRSTIGMLPSTSTVSGSGSTVVYTTTIPTTIVTVTPPISQPKAVEQPVDPPKVIEPPSTPPKAVEPPSPPSEPMEPSPVVKGEIFSFSLKGERIAHSFLVLDVKPELSEWSLTYQRIYEHPQTGAWYLVSSDEKREDIYYDSMWGEDGFGASGEVLNIETISIQPNYIQPIPRFAEDDIVKVKENDGKWNTYLIESYDDSKRYDIYFTKAIVPKEDGSWGYVEAPGIIDQWSDRKWIDASTNSLHTHLNSRDGLEWISPPLPDYTPKPPTIPPTPCGTGCSPVNISKK